VPRREVPSCVDTVFAAPRHDTGYGPAEAFEARDYA